MNGRAILDQRLNAYRNAEKGRKRITLMRNAIETTEDLRSKFGAKCAPWFVRLFRYFV